PDDGPSTIARSDGSASHDVTGSLAIPCIPARAPTAELFLLQLAGRRLRQRVEELHEARHREPRHPLLAVVEQRLGSEPLPRLEHHAPLDLVLTALVGRLDGHHGALRDERMGADDLLDLEGRDVLAAPPDAILDPVDEEQTPPRVEASGIPGMEPEILPSL